MENRDKMYLTAMVAIVVAFVGGLLLPSPVQATGGAGEISKLIMPMIDRAIEYLEQGNTDAALEEINTLKQELQDTFEADKNE